MCQMRWSFDSVESKLEVYFKYGGGVQKMEGTWTPMSSVQEE